MARRGIEMSLADVERHQRHHGFLPDGTSTNIEASLPPSVLKMPTPRMNKTESAFGRILEAEKQRGDIIEYAFEPFSLRYGDDAFYKPDWVARVAGKTTIEDLTKLCSLHVIDIYSDINLLSYYESLVESVVFKHFRIIEVKGPHIYPEAKPRFKAAKLRHGWAEWEMWQRKKGEWTRIL